MAAESPKKQTQFKPNQTQFPKSPNEYKLTYNKRLQKKRLFSTPKNKPNFFKGQNRLPKNLATPLSTGVAGKLL
jgi:hypothetical protein